MVRNEKKLIIRTQTSIQSSTNTHSALAAHHQFQRNEEGDILGGVELKAQFLSEGVRKHRSKAPIGLAFIILLPGPVEQLENIPFHYFLCT